MRIDKILHQCDWILTRCTIKVDCKLAFSLKQAQASLRQNCTLWQQLVTSLRPMAVRFCTGLVDCSCGKGMPVPELFLLDKHPCFLITFSSMETYESNCTHTALLAVHISGLPKHVLAVFLILVLYRTLSVRLCYGIRATIGWVVAIECVL